MKYCTNCGAAMEDDFVFCTHCGQRFPTAAAPAEESKEVMPTAAPATEQAVATPETSSEELKEAEAVPAAEAEADSQNSPAQVENPMVVSRHILFESAVIPDYNKALEMLADVNETDENAKEVQGLKLAGEMYRMLDVLRHSLK